MKSSTSSAILTVVAIACIQIAFSVRPDDGGWNSQPYIGDSETEQEMENGDELSIIDLLLSKPASKEKRCDINRFQYCIRQVVQAASQNTTYTSCSSALDVILDSETFEPSQLRPVCRVYMEANLCAEQTNCEIQTALEHIQRTKTSKYPRDMKYCYDVSKKACTDIDIAPVPFCLVNCQVKIKVCFGEDATVLTEDGRRLTMKQLSVGDRVLAADSVTGNKFYDEVITFQHRDESRSSPAPFIHLSLAGETEVSLTPHHMIYSATREEIHRSMADNLTTIGRAKFAVDVKPGDFVFSISGPGEEYERREVLAVNLKFEYSGLYAPLTTSGNIVVDGVLMSCYALTSSHELAHWMWAPVRAFHLLSKYFPSMLSSSLFNGLSTYTEEGVHRYGMALHDIAVALPFADYFYLSN